MIPDGLEPSFSGCRPEVVAAGPRDQIEKWTHRESHPDPRFAGPMSSCWTMSPFVLQSAEAVGLEPTTVVTAPVFKTGSSSSRMTSVSSCGSWNRTSASGFRAQRHCQQQLSRRCAEKRESRIQSQVRAVRLRQSSILNPLTSDLRGQESNLRTRRSKRRISTSRNYPAIG
jgi:hypothetical protein